MTRALWRAVAAAAAVVTLAAGCNAAGADSALRTPAAATVRELKVGFTQQTLAAPYYVAMTKELERLAAEQGFTVNTVSANDDAGTQIQQIEDLVAKGVNVLIVNPVEPETERVAVQSVSRRLPVIFVDNMIMDVGAVTAVASDNLTIGTKAGLIAAERIGRGKEIRMGILHGPATDTIVGPARREGFLRGLADGGVRVSVVAEVNAEYTREQAVGATEDMLAAHPDIEFIFGQNDAMALGALTTLRSKGKTGVLVSGMDGQKEAFQEILQGGCAGQFVSTGLNSPTLAARQAAAIAVEVGTGKRAAKDVPPITYTQADGIGCRNVGQFYLPDATF